MNEMFDVWVWRIEVNVDAEYFTIRPDAQERSRSCWIIGSLLPCYCAVDETGKLAKIE
ncbi:hypothetical protein T4B_5895 [Trichinella pseudospiralis]|uniref:Uncharacterized protein n=1 Tax=Trichinella pseudospiralis TaxID=6337 RepID=A0A0V1IK99_TRIPS|nr:hypothetical protein T4E_8253 [Trichinella pseudospiralis]KRY75993.1 hypothetical protein T4A_6089 [Trichinella pseudospiralis]KRZ23231.1 hypothetical protein T4C_13216 [Trichinella pseudospiralis]KRZ28950.1 hypothetical protein T4B_5895 [Trichinella pseudospiralis]KRZ40731.1 hypothetical protein T4C_7606 [Trichinella pseudospiralis]